MAREPASDSAVLGGRYVIERVLGTGGMATVYLAHDRKYDRQVSVKVLRDELTMAVGVERFLREISTAAQLNHPHIVSLYDSGESNGQLYYVMPFIDGESLRDRLTREGQLPIDAAIGITRQVAGGLDYAHTRGVIHRDIKPENILLYENEAFVADFGLACALGAARDELTATGMVVGTPLYMSPEQATSDERVDARSDIYSLACVLYEMLAGDPPFAGTSAHAVLARKVVERVPSLRTVRETVPRQLEDILFHALATSPADRFATAAGFSAALGRLGSDDVSARHRWNTRTLQRAGVALVAAAAIVAVWLGVDGMRASTARVRSLVVLPPQSLSGTEQPDYLIDATHADLTGAVTSIQELRVIPRRSSLRYKAGNASITEIGRALKVDGVLETAVAWGRDSVRINVQLNQVSPERQLWQQGYSSAIHNLPALYSLIATDITRQINARAAQGSQSVKSNQPAMNEVAFHAWARARYHWTRLTPRDLEECVRFAQQAVAADSAFAPAYALLSHCHSRRTFVGNLTPHDLFPTARAAAQRALALDESLADAHFALARVLALYDWDWSGAERAFQRGLELNPNSATGHQLYGWFLAWLGRVDKALSQVRHAEQLDPGTPETRTTLAAILYVGRRYRESIDEAQLSIQFDSTYAFAYNRLAASLLMIDSVDAAVAAAETAVRLGRGDTRREGLLCAAYARAGRTKDARRLLAELQRLSSEKYVPPTTFAWCHVGLGEYNEAISDLERAYEVRDSDMVIIGVWPFWEPLRSNPRFQRLVALMKDPQPPA
jgi:serine/threonine protein kinase/Flp pilus assembly protein TadD